MSTLAEIQQMIEDCESRASQLTDWETDFIDSVATQVGRGSSNRRWNSILFHMVLDV